MMLCDSCRVQQIICFIILRVLRFAVGIESRPAKAFFGLWLWVFHLFDNYILVLGIMPKHMLLPICSLLPVLYWFSEEVHSRRFSYDVCDSPRNNANHFQMTYLLIFLLILSGYFIYQDIKKER
jgi:hypothetical protein